MNINKNNAYRVGNTVFTGMSSAQVDKLDRIMNPRQTEYKPSITLKEYIDRFNPSVRRWTSKSGNAMVEIEILSDKISGHLCCNPTIIQQEAHLESVTVYLKETAE